MLPMTKRSSIVRAASLWVYLCCAIMSAAQDTLTITLTGDILLDRGVRRYIQKAGIDSLFSPETDSIFAHSDIVVGNLECPATNLRTPATKKYVFRANPEWLDCLQRHGITHLNLANNHSVDQRRGGLQSTYKNCLQAGIVPVGAGRTMAEASEPVLLTTCQSSSATRPVYLFASQRLRLENFTYLPDSFSVSQENMDSLCQRIKRLRTAEPSAFIIVSLHWGAEHQLHPTLYQQKEAHRIIDAGADCMVCHHTHTFQTVEQYRGKPIYYSIGNFIFDQTKPINTRAAMVQIRIAPTSVEVKTIPIEIRHCVPYLFQP